MAATTAALYLHSPCRSPSTSTALRITTPIPLTRRHRNPACSSAPSDSITFPFADSTPPQLTLSVGTHLIPHPRKVESGGEDAFFVGSYCGGVMAVADGVSGWAERNVDPSLFSRELMANLSSLLEASAEGGIYDPQLLLKEAHEFTTSIGSATVIIAMLEKEGILKIANVGDCGLRVIRDGRIIFATSPKEHYFDCPYQLSSEEVGQTYLDAAVSSVKVTDRDTIVMGSDGLFDNVFDHEILSTVASYNDVAATAKALCDLASKHSVDPSFDSPYIMEAREKGFDVPMWKKFLGMKLTGGKPDDITVIIGQVVLQSHPTDS